MVTSNRLRPPALLAKMAATADQVSDGRVILGIGAGGSRVADPAGRELVEREFAANGIDVVAPREAVEALGEACTVIRRLWTETEALDFEGRHYRLRGAVCEPKPVQRPNPPILIGAGRSAWCSAPPTATPSATSTPIDSPDLRRQRWLDGRRTDKEKASNPAGMGTPAISTSRGATRWIVWTEVS
jgi:alkanesulfonate monooxygenase SsuD/methylene tetrahydromethanopterin reductase-like flavin-dependent oxidoreductase (luciferase family)